MFRNPEDWSSACFWSDVHATFRVSFSWAANSLGVKVPSDECPQTLNRLAAAARGAAGVALEAGTVADHGEVAAFGAAFAFIALHPGLCDLLGHPEE